MTRAFLTAALLLLVLGGYADAADKLHVGLRDVIDTVEQSYRQLDNVTADFFQRSTMSGNQRELRAEGEMIVKPPSGNDPLMFRFDYFRPTKQEIVSDGRTLWFYMPESRQVIRSDVRELFGTMRFDPEHPDHRRPVNFLQGLGRISRDFTITFSEQQQDAAGNYVLVLEPLRPTAFITKMFMVVRQEAVLNRKDPQFFKARGEEFRRNLLFPILSTTVVDHQGNTTIMEFTNIRANSFVSPSMFDFVVPANVQIVRPPTGTP
ncbi:MAG TPA: outer membrane lipoprotein carrier protein LolA [Geobacteraceae bacterium]